MFNHPQIRVIQWFPFAPEPKYELIGNPQAVYLMVRRRLFFKLKHILNRIVQELDCIYVPAPEICAQFPTTRCTTQVLSNVLTTTAQPSLVHPHYSGTATS
jgi:hypothetical protein